MATPPELFFIGVFMGLTGAALFGVSNVVYKSQSSEIHPIAINTFKMWIALPVIIVVVMILLVPTGFFVPLASIPYLILSIIFGAGIGDIFYLTSQARIGVSRAFPVAMSFPLITYIVSLILFLEPLLITRLVGVILAVLGVIFIGREEARQDDVGPKTTEIPAQSDWDKLGFVFALFAAVSWASATIILQFGLVGADPIDANLVRILVGSAVLLPVFLIARKRGIPMPSKRATKFTLVAGFFGMGLGSIMYVNTVKFTGAAVTSVIAATAPLFALPFSIFILKEKMTRLILFGTLLTVIGIWLVVLGF